MRNIKKSINVKTVVRYLYDRAAKQEITDTVTVADSAEMPPLPENCVLIEQQTVSEKEVVYTMTPQTFLAHATAVTE